MLFAQIFAYLVMFLWHLVPFRWRRTVDQPGSETVSLGSLTRFLIRRQNFYIKIYFFFYFKAFNCVSSQFILVSLERKIKVLEQPLRASQLFLLSFEKLIQAVTDFMHLSSTWLKRGAGDKRVVGT